MLLDRQTIWCQGEAKGPNGGARKETRVLDCALGGTATTST